VTRVQESSVDGLSADEHAVMIREILGIIENSDQAGRVQ
jgi:hypothetical protein